MKNIEMLLSFDAVKGNREEIISRISEGCKVLENILNYCINLNLSMIVCYVGYKLMDYPYIMMNYDKYTRKMINEFLNV